MKKGDTVFQCYSGIHRYGKIKDIKHNLKGDQWSWFSIEWIDDEKFINSQKWKAKMRGLAEDSYTPEYYRADDIQKIDINKSIRTLLKLKELI